MKILFVTNRGQSACIAQRVQKEGHDVTYYVVDPKASLVAEGLLKRKITDGRPLTDVLKRFTPALVVFDTPLFGFSEIAEDIANTGTPVLGAEKWSRAVIADRAYMKTLLVAAGFRVNSNHTPTPYVLCGWFNGEKMVYPTFAYVEHRLMSGDTRRHVGGVGPEINCAGVVIPPLREVKRGLLDHLTKLEGGLQETSYRGLVTLSVTLSGDTVDAQELTPLLSCDLTQTLLAGLRGKIGEFLYAIATGASSPTEMLDYWLMSVRLSFSPYPQQHGIDWLKGRPVGSVPPEDERYIWFRDVLKNGKEYACTGVDGVVGCVTARAPTLSRAQSRAYRTIARLSNPDLQYRTDIGCNMFKINDGWRR